jgi:hypothetical protein
MMSFAGRAAHGRIFRNHEITRRPHVGRCVSIAGRSHAGRRASLFTTATDREVRDVVALYALIAQAADGGQLPQRRPSAILVPLVGPDATAADVISRAASTQRGRASGLGEYCACSRGRNDATRTANRTKSLDFPLDGLRLGFARALAAVVHRDGWPGRSAT